MSRRRRRRRRCAYVDHRTGRRCGFQVKDPRCRFCCVRHAALARRTERSTTPGARAVAQKAAQKALEALLDELRAMADSEGRVAVAAVQTVLEAHLGRARRSGYHAGLVVGQKRSRMLRLTLSRDAIHGFLGTRFGKAFMDGTLSPDALSRFSFGGRS